MRIGMKILIVVILLLIFSSSLGTCGPIPGPKINPYLSTFAPPNSGNTPFWLGKINDCDSCNRVNNYPSSGGIKLWRDPSSIPYEWLDTVKDFRSRYNDKYSKLYELIRGIYFEKISTEKKMEMAKEAKQIWNDLEKLAKNEGVEMEIKFQECIGISLMLAGLSPGENPYYILYIYDVILK